MKWQLTPEDIASYDDQGFVIIENFLGPEELEIWRSAVERAVSDRQGRRFSNQDIKIGDDNSTDPDAEYYNKVFDQLLNLWQTDDQIKALMLDPRIGEMASTLAGTDGMRVWHDQALIKKPWANPTAFHLDTPFWSFSNRKAISIWIALDDATSENGCLYFFPDSHKKTTFDTPGIARNMDAVFVMYPEFQNQQATQATMKAGSASFHNGLCIHGAGANMTPYARRAMSCAFMPEGSTFNGQQNILTGNQMANLRIGDELNDDKQNPIVFSR